MVGERRGGEGREGRGGEGRGIEGRGGGGDEREGYSVCRVVLPDQWLCSFPSCPV